MTWKMNIIYMVEVEITKMIFYVAFRKGIQKWSAEKALTTPPRCRNKQTKNNVRYVKYEED